MKIETTGGIKLILEAETIARLSEETRRLLMEAISAVISECGPRAATTTPHQTKDVK